ncbi:MAG: tetratricopeptide repeat protein, partial [Candidatus Aminicenantes bacterium]|nr:tetratricopeptide repeat protein [Candidatus Aminicenantes bacterium]
MRKFKKGYWIILYVGFAIVFISLPASLLAAQKEFVEETPGGMETSFQEQKAEQESVFRSKFENLPAEYQERARRLGYKEGDMVEMQRDSSGALIVLPPLTEYKTPGQMREKVRSLIAGKIVQKMTDDVKVTVRLALEDGTGYYTIQLKFEALYKELQTQAKKLGFRKGDTVEVRLDAVTWKYRVLPKEKETKFSGDVLEIIPPKEPGGSPSYRVIAKYSVMPKDQQKRAKKMGYDKKDLVIFIYREDTKEYEILPPPFVFGSSKSFEKLESKKKVKARSLGYKEGDTVWFKTGRTLLDQSIVPKAKVGSGPLFEIKQGKMEKDKYTGESKLILECIARFEDLGANYRQLAREKGYKEGDKVRLNYDIEADKYEIKSSGVQKSPVKAPAAIKKPIAEMDADAYTDRGFSYFTKGLYDKAMSDYNKAIEIDPKNSRAYNFRGTGYHYKGLYDKAIADYTKAIELDPKNATGYAIRGDVYHAKGLYDRAISDFTKAIELEPKYEYVDAYIGRGLAYGHKGLYDQAIADFTKLIEINPKLAVAYSNRGVAYGHKGLYDQAIADFTKTIRINPKYVLAFYYKALSYEKTGRVNKALKAYKTFIQNTPPNKYASFIEEAKKKIKELEKRSSTTAIKSSGVRKKPVRAQVSLRSEAGSLSGNELGKMLKRKNFFSKQLKDVNKNYCNPGGDFTNEYEVKTIRGDEVVLDHMTGLMWHQSGSEAPMKFDKAKQWGSELNRRGYAGYSDWRLPTLEEGASLIERSKMNGDLHIDPKFSAKQILIWTSDTVSGKGLLRVWVVTFDDGCVLGNRLIPSSSYVRPVRSGFRAPAAIKSSGVRKKPVKAPAPIKEPRAEMDADAYIERGHSYRKKRLYGKAIADYNKAIEIDPKYAKAYLYRGTAYDHKGLCDEAISDYTKAIEIDPKYVKAYSNRGIVYHNKGLYDEAISDYTKAIELEPMTFNVSLYINRGDAYDHKGLYDKAIS